MPLLNLSKSVVLAVRQAYHSAKRSVVGLEQEALAQYSRDVKANPGVPNIYIGHRQIGYMCENFI